MYFKALLQRQKHKYQEILLFHLLLTHKVIQKQDTETPLIIEKQSHYQVAVINLLHGTMLHD